MKKYLTYHKQKTTNISWLGNIPTHWKAKKLKFLSALINSKINVEESDLPYLGLEHIESWTGRKIDGEISNSEGIASSFAEGDILFGKLRPYLAKVHLAQENGLISSEALVVRSKSELHPTFLKYFMLSRDFINIVDSSTYGSKMPRASWDFIGNLKITYPEIEEQQKIAEFLDYKTAKIDALIAKKETLLLKLQEKRSALITQAVTKGINPNAPMKPSGVEWLGDVPAHWEVLSLRHTLVEPLSNGIFKKKDQWGSGSRIVDVFDIYVDGDVIDEDSLQRVDCNEDELDKYSALHGDFFFVRSSLKLDGIGKSALLSKPQEKMVFECHLVRGRPDLERVDPKFYIYLLNSQYCRQTLVALSNQVTMTTLDQEKFKGLKVPFPPKEEQETITKYLDEKTSAINMQLIRTQDVISKLTEYRSALITNAVTGKIDVRDFELNKTIL